MSETISQTGTMNDDMSAEQMQTILERQKQAYLADGVVSTEEEQKMQFTPCETEPGDVVVFSSYVPHRSRPNLSDTSRNLLYLTYNAQSEGYQRDEYCA